MAFVGVQSMRLPVLTVVEGKVNTGKETDRTGNFSGRGYSQKERIRMFNPFMMATNLGIVVGVWTTFICLLTGVI